MKKKMVNLDKKINLSENQGWSISKIRDKSVGEILEETRREQNLSIETISRTLNIHPGHLFALESGNYQKMPGGVYLEKIFENYVNFLNIDFGSIKKKFDKELGASRTTKRQTFTPKISQKNFIITPRLLKIAFAAIAVILLLVYLGFEINNIFAPPPLSVTSPIDNLITSEPRIEIVGQTAKEVKVKINDQEIQPDAQGEFRESVLLQPGLNVIKVSAVKKRSRENIIYRQVILK
jgi:cytoskeletal protein RodZ